MEIIERSPRGYIHSPDKVIDVLMEGLDLNNKVVCEPSAGQGHIARRIMNQFKPKQLDCYEIHEPFVRILMDKGFSVISNDFLSVMEVPKYDAIIMNPPFDKNMVEVKHLLRAINMLKQDGYIRCVLPRPYTVIHHLLTDVDVIELPLFSFMPYSGTSAVVLKGRKL